jgi:hypothetical protein
MLETLETTHQGNSSWSSSSNEHLYRGVISRLDSAIIQYLKDQQKGLQVSRKTKVQSENISTEEDYVYLKLYKTMEKQN